MFVKSNLTLHKFVQIDCVLPYGTEWKATIMDGKIRNNSNSANEELNNIDTTVNCFWYETWHQSSVTIRTKCFIRTFSCDCFFLLSFSASLLFFSSLLSAFLAFFELSVLLSTPSLSPLSEHETRQTDFRNVSPFSFPRYFFRI